MDTHVKILGILHIVFGALGLLAGLFVMALFGGIAGLVGAFGNGGESIIAIPILGGIGALVLIACLVLSLPGLIAGIGLVKYRPWARVLTIILSVLNLFNFPFGTALGVYGLWVLLSNDTQRLFNGRSAAATAAYR
ncbi:MAG: hypothetical protein JST93_19965 [Acidobacteria bacterium]|nr:hypothetical protein [Acidobacteriota bacterium]